MMQKTKKPRLTVNNSSENRGKKIWTLAEDERLRELVLGMGDASCNCAHLLLRTMSFLPSFVSANTIGIQLCTFLPSRTSKQCRERYHNHLASGIKVGDWTAEEDQELYVLQNVMGSQWTKISQCMPGRTDNSVKNRFHLLQRAVNRGAYDVSFMADASFVQGVVSTRMSEDYNTHCTPNMFYQQQQLQGGGLSDRPRRAIKRPASYLEYHVEPDEVIAATDAPTAAGAAVFDPQPVATTNIVTVAAVTSDACEHRYQHHAEEEEKLVPNEAAFEMLCAQLHLPDINFLDLGFEENSTFWLEDVPSSDGGDASPFPARSSSSNSIS